MKFRCTEPNCKDYSNYGGRGIKIEESFDTFRKFFDWSINNGYNTEDKLSIDRINNDGNYSSNNCRWITKSENILNQKNVNLTIEDVNWIRSDEFTLEEALNKLKCSKYTIMNIREYRTFKDV
jgi:hypothetical protein